MASTDTRIEHRKLWLKYLAYGSTLVLAAAVFLGWMMSFINNKSYISEVRKTIASYKEIPDTADDWESGVKNLHKKLALLKSAGRIQENNFKWMGMGLDQRAKINNQIYRSYEKTLTAQLFPVIKTRLEQRLAEDIDQFNAGDQDKTGDLYNLLKVYLMLEHRSSEEKKAGLDLAVEKIGEDWDLSFQREPEQFKTGYREHFKDLLSLDFKKALNPLNEVLIADAREKLNSVPLYKQIYNQLKSKYLPDKKYNFQVKNITYIDHIFGQSVLEMTIPGLFTAAGYNEIFNKQGTRLIENARKHNWVIENPDAENESSDTNALYDNLQRIYFIDYVKKWAFLLETLTISPSTDVYDSNKILHRLTSGKDNPLHQLLREVAANTSFIEEKAPNSDELGANIKQFKRLNDLIRENDNEPPQLDEIIARLEKLRDLMHRYDSSEVALDDLKKWILTGEDSISSTQKYAEQLPDPFNEWLLSLTTSIRKAMLKSAKSTLNSMWNVEVMAPYRETLAGRYPLSKFSSENVSLDDFNRFFQPNGIIDKFFREHIKPFVNSNWEEKRVDNRQLGLLSASALEQFKRSERIRQIYFMGSTLPHIKFELKPEFLDASVKEFALSIEGKNIKYSHGRPRTEEFQWPKQDGSPVPVVEWSFKTFDGQLFSYRQEGPWAWFRTLDSIKLSRKGQNLFNLTFRANGYEVRYKMLTGSVVNPFGSTELQAFHCPESL